MNSVIKYSLLAFAAINLTACSSMMSGTRTSSTEVLPNNELAQATPTEGVTQSGPIGGKFEGSMDENDKQKLSRAMDSGIGKSTTWVNGASGVSYTVVPTKKVTVGSNKICRQYTVTMEKNDMKDKINGTACVTEDGAWHPA
jgi:surface antigen